MKTFYKIFDWLLNLILGLAALICLWVVMQVFFFTSFRIPSDSMEPELVAGDCVFVLKPLSGPRLFNLFASMKGEQVEIYRLPGVQKTERNDVLVFNFPHPERWDKIEMHIMKYYIKRCIGLPGDTLSIENGYYRINGIQENLGNRASQERIGKLKEEDFDKGVYRSFPFDSTLNWNIQHFGPLYVPKAGEHIQMDHLNLVLYRKVIEWEQNGKLSEDSTGIYLDGKKLDEYRFLKNYYFMGGDKGENSQDSRYWGFLPEEYIVGKASFIWKSVDPYTKEWRWDRYLKEIR